MTDRALIAIYRKLLLCGLAAAMAFGAGLSATEAKELSARPFTDLYIFGDSLSDSGNLFAASGGTAPPSSPYFDGHFSDGPVWVESLAPLLDLEVDFETSVFVDPLANNQAIAGAFAGFGSVSGGPFGVLEQVESFSAAGGRFERDDLVIVWAGANNYFGGDTDPEAVVKSLLSAVKELSRAGARRFLLPNLPDLGATPGGVAGGDPEGLSALTAAHNAVPAGEVAKLRKRGRLEVALLDVNAAFGQILDDSAIFGFDIVDAPCLVQLPDGTRPPTGLCPPLGDSFDSAGVLFWDLIHPSAAGHRMIAIVAHSTLQALQNRAVKARGQIAVK